MYNCAGKDQVQEVCRQKTSTTTEVKFSQEEQAAILDELIKYPSNKPRTSYPFAQVAGEDEVSGEGVGEGRVKLQHLQQGFPLDDVEVAVR